MLLDPEIAQQVKTIMAESRQSMRKVINDLLRKALAKSRAGEKQKPYKLKPFPSGVPAGFLPGRFNQLYDELEVNGFLSERSAVVQSDSPAYKKE